MDTKTIFLPVLNLKDLNRTLQAEQYRISLTQLVTTLLCWPLGAGIEQGGAEKIGQIPAAITIINNRPC